MLKRKKSGKHPVNFFPALYPVEYDCAVIGDLTPDAVLSGANAIVLFKSFHLRDIKIRKNIPGCGKFVKYQPLYL